MNLTKTQKVFSIYVALILIIGIVTFFMASVPGDALLGLLAGAISAGVNYFLLHLAMKFLMSSNWILAIQSYVARILIYLLAIVFSVKVGISAAASFGAAVVAISLSIFIVYGIGGLKSHD